jgi:hypothetical protein
MTLYAGNLPRQWQAVINQFEALDPALPIKDAVNRMTPRSMDDDGLIIFVQPGDETAAKRARSTLEGITVGVFEQRIPIRFMVQS